MLIMTEKRLLQILGVEQGKDGQVNELKKQVSGLKEELEGLKLKKTPEVPK